MTTSADHNLVTGDRVLIEATNSAFTKWAEVTVTGVRIFTYLTSVAGTPGSATAVRKLYGIDRLLIENNIVGLATATSGDLVAIQVSSMTPTGLQDATYPAYPHGQLILRGNTIRYLDGAYDAGYVGSGIKVSGAKNAMTQDNVVETAPANPVRNEWCGTMTYLNNRTPAGVLVRGYDSVGGLLYDELETEAEDALVMSLFNER